MATASNISVTVVPVQRLDYPVPLSNAHDVGSRKATGYQAARAHLNYSFNNAGCVCVCIVIRTSVSRGKHEIEHHFSASIQSVSSLCTAALTGTVCAFDSWIAEHSTKNRENCFISSDSSSGDTSHHLF